MATALISISPGGAAGSTALSRKTGLVGIARMAAESPQVRARADTEYFAMQSRSTLNRESSGRMPFAWTLNPYRGCEFGCKYCYARYSHEFMEMWDGLDFERKIFAKVNSPELLREELRRARDKGLPIALGTATDPYQPAEKQFGITRNLLEVFADFAGLDFSITTKGTLILRDLDLLRTIASRHRFSVHITVTTLDERLARLLEPKAPPPVNRLEAVAELARAGIRVGVNAMPILPGLTDSERSLDQLAGAAAQAGARFLHGNILFLMPSAMRQFMPFLEREFPRLVKRYRKLYARSAYLDGEYKEQIKKRMADLRARYGLAGERAPDHVAAHRLPRRGQLALSFLPSHYIGRDRACP
ncbi:MAG TPA: radical SAM protein [Terriglobia bacterium]|nr:radical SAM protein [Terriglobia bacterium]